MLSPLVQAADWPRWPLLRQQSRARGVEGLMLKHRQSAYGSGRTKADGLWWKWKIAPHTVDAVLVYAQAGHGRRAGLYTDYTFAVWNRPPADAAEAEAWCDAIAAASRPQPGALQLVTFAKAYSGLSDAEFKQVDRGDPRPHAGEVRPGAQPQAQPGVRAGVRGHRAQPAPQERHRAALPAHAAHPPRQAAARGRHVGDAAGFDGTAAIAFRSWRGSSRPRYAAR
jgi:ATP-dependent DNA ligase